MMIENVEYVRAIDGDTIVVNIPGLPNIFGKNISIRLAGIQCPELRAKSESVRGFALRAKQFTARKCQDSRNLVLANIKRGKYFRLVADVFYDGNHINSELVSKGLAFQV